MIDETQDREILGTVAHVGVGVGSVTLTETDKTVEIDAKYNSQLTPTQARKLARHLNRLARRIDARSAA